MDFNKIKKIKKNIFKVISTKIDIIPLIINHLDTLKNYKTDKLLPQDIITFFIIPLIISLICIFIRIKLNEKAIETITLGLTIFIPVMFSLLVAIFTINTDNINNRTRNLLINFKSNVSFIIIISLILLVVIGIYYLKINIFPSLTLISGVIIYLLVLIFLTILMILKRWNYLLDKKNRINYYILKIKFPT